MRPTGNVSSQPDGTLIHRDETDSGQIAIIVIAIVSGVIIVLGLVRIFFFFNFFKTFFFT